ncbi:MAG: MAPEG family protein [Rhodobiaceae bacterium]|nr:MAPEG family protein [Rhodobiaceae bacterium]MCC0041184.1 MAPEG family protein [Rhodobiaceae bacterium]
MSTDLAMLIAACVLALVQIGIYGIFAMRQLGVVYAAGPRDEERPITGVAGRLKRAYQNHLETLPLFAAGVIVAHLAGEANATTALASQIYVAARVAYVPLYAFGIPLRSLAWGVATAAIAVIFVVALD